MNNRLSLDSAVFLAGFTAILYTWSTAHYNSFLRVLGLDADMMERSFHQVIYSGLLLSFVPALLILFLFASVLYFYSHALLPSYIDWVRKSMRSRRNVVKFRHFWFGKRNSPPIELRAKAFFTKVAIMTLFGVLYVASLVYFENVGKQKAKDLVEVHLKGKNKPNQMVSAKIGKKEKILRFLGCGTRSCAGIEEETNRIFYYASSLGYSYLHQEPNVISQASGPP